jgi:hypothetical protein
VLSVLESWQYQMADHFLSSYSLMLESKRLILSGLSRRRRSTPQLRARSRALQLEIDRLGDKRDTWALRCSPDEPQRWVTLYQRLISRYQQTCGELRQELHRMDPESRRDFMVSDLPSLEAEIRHFQLQLRYWQRQLLDRSTASEEPRPSDERLIPRLRLVRGDGGDPR